jgi:hypothetical protein
MSKGHLKNLLGKRPTHLLKIVDVNIDLKYKGKETHASKE